jgi:hypothetical protein
MLLSSSNISALRKICNDLLTNPTSVKNSDLGIRETPFQIWNSSSISRLLCQIIWILKVKLMVGTASEMLAIVNQHINSSIPKIGPPFPLASIGSPELNCGVPRFSRTGSSTAGAAWAKASKREQVAPRNFMMKMSQRKMLLTWESSMQLVPSLLSTL